MAVVKRKQKRYKGNGSIICFGERWMEEAQCEENFKVGAGREI
jgi:hypothetical protein